MPTLALWLVASVIAGPIVGGWLKACAGPRTPGVDRAPGYDCPAPVASDLLSHDLNDNIAGVQDNGR